MRGLILILWSLWIAGPALGATYFVAPDGNDSADGSDGTPWLTIQKGLNTATNGDVIFLKPGQYPALAEGPVNKEVTLTGTKDAWITNSVSITNSSFTLSNVTVKTKGIWMDQRDRPVCTITNWLISDVVFRDGVGPSKTLLYWDGHDATTTNGASFGRLVSCVFSNAIAYHFCAINGSGNIVESNLFTAPNGWDCLRFAGWSNIVRFNQFLNLADDTNNENHCDIIQTYAGTTNVVSKEIRFYGNVISNSTAQLMNLTDDGAPNIHSWYWYNNLILKSRLQANIYISRVYMMNNTFWRCDHAVSPVAFKYGEDGRGIAHSPVVCNNFFIESYNYTDGTTGANYGWYTFAGGATPLTNFIGDYNWIAGLGGASKNVFTLNVGTETNGINGGYPGFVSTNSGSLDMRLTAGSAAIGAGTNLSAFGFTTDISGLERGATWDIGAYEYSTNDATGVGRRVMGSGTYGVGTY